MHPLFFIPCSVLFQSLCNHMPTGWNSWKCPSCSVHCAALLPLFVYTWATSATGYEKECHIWHLNASPYLLYVKEFSLSQGQLHSHCTLHLQTPGITIPGAVLVISNLYKGGEKTVCKFYKLRELENWEDFTNWCAAALKSVHVWWIFQTAARPLSR